MTVARLIWFFDERFDDTPSETLPALFGAGRYMILFRHFYDDADEETADLLSPLVPDNLKFVRGPKRSPVRPPNATPVRTGGIHDGQ